jgi:hypothetical protein
MNEMSSSPLPPEIVGNLRRPGVAVGVLLDAVRQALE